MKKINRILLWLSFATYFIILIWIISFKCNKESMIFECLYTFKNKSIGERFSVVGKPSFNVSFDFLLNILLFLPLGMFLPLLSKKESIGLQIFIASILTTVIEFVQLLTCIGMWAFTDIIANILGFICGMFIFKLLKKCISNKIINIINLVIIVIALPIADYAIVNTIIHFEVYSYSYYIAKYNLAIK